jgi:hypothetical protein
MINKGRRGHLFLYEVTEQDLMIPDELAKAYRPGNVLVFADKKSVGLGGELARADDLESAYDYIQNNGAIMYGRAMELQAKVNDLNDRIRQRDELLGDLSEDLRCERQINDILRAQIDDVRSRIHQDELSREELVGDLQTVSEEMQGYEAALEKTINEKLELESELASRITDLVELNVQYDELKAQLELSAQKAGQGDDGDRLPETGQIVTVGSGKQVHVYHEFPQAPRRTLRTATSLGARLLLRACLAVCVAMLLIVLLSVAATAQFNGISMGEALDLLLGMALDIYNGTAA